MNEKKLSRTNIGNSGEYFVAAELERRGFQTAILSNNCKNFDIIAYYIETDVPIFIQVKTTEGYKKQDKKKTKWLMSSCKDKGKMNNLFYVMVDLNYLYSPVYHIVPAKVVYSQTEKRHKEWKKTHLNSNDNMREFFDTDNKYINNWELLIEYCKKNQ